MWIVKMIYMLCLVSKGPGILGVLAPWRFGRLSFLSSFTSCFPPAAMMWSGGETLLWQCEELQAHSGHRLRFAQMGPKV